MTESVSRADRSSPSVPLCGCFLVVPNCPGKLGPAAHAKLAEDLAQVILDGAGADEQPGSDLPVGQMLGDQPRDLLLLGGEHLRGFGATRAGPLASGAQVAPGPARERLHAHRVEHGEGGAKLVPGVAAAALAAQPLAVEEVGAGELGTVPGTTEPVDPLAIMLLSGFVPAQQGAGARLDPQPQVGSAGPGLFGEQIQGVAGDARVAGACGGLDQLGQRP